MTFDVETVAGPAKAYSYTLPWDSMHHLAVVYGDIRDGVDISVRLHLESVVDDVFGKEKVISAILDRMAEEGRGVVVYLARARWASARRAAAGFPRNMRRRRIAKPNGGDRPRRADPERPRHRLH